LTLSHEMNLLKVVIHPINFWTSWRLSVGFILVIANTFNGLGSIPRWEMIYPSSFPKGMPKVHLSGLRFILNFHELSKVYAWSEMSPLSF
jgi:hypothetical protein